MERLEFLRQDLKTPQQVIRALQETVTGSNCRLNEILSNYFLFL